MPLESDFESRALPNTFVLELTRRCNNFCLYCYAAEGPLDRNKEPCGSGEMDTEEICGLIARLCDHL